MFGWRFKNLYYWSSSRSVTFMSGSFKGIRILFIFCFKRIWCLISLFTKHVWLHWWLLSFCFKRIYNRILFSYCFKRIYLLWGMTCFLGLFSKGITWGCIRHFVALTTMLTSCFEWINTISFDLGNHTSKIPCRKWVWNSFYL